MRKRNRPLNLLIIVWAVSCLLWNGTVMAQRPAEERPARPPINQSDDPILKKFRWRSIGPASMGGRIDDIVAVESNPYTFYIGLATGGVWKTTNNGTTWEPIFDTYPVASIGDLAVSQSDPNILWVGTGEPNNRQSSSWGDGIYKSTDAGKTFTNVGLKETHTIARIVLDPKDNNIVYVAALGHLFGPNPERGIFKTTDGGKTWANVKFIDADTGFTDIVMDPSDNKTLYAASYQRRRAPWGFNGGGPGSGLWKTTDAGKTWTKMEGAGLPSGLLGRIGLDVSRSNPNVVYAQIEVGPSGGAGGGGGFPGGGGGGGRGQQQAERPPDPKRSGVWRSDDKGKTWQIMSNNNNRPMYYSQIRVDPKNDQIIYTCGAPFHKSTDGGKSFRVLQGPAHVDHHAVWINPQNTDHIILGNDGGLNVSYDQGDTWEFINTMALAQAYAVGVDMRKPYYVYCGLQDNGTWGGPSATRSNAGITNADWFRAGGGDGFYVQPDPTDHNTVYSESQDGNIRRLDLKTGQSTSIRPRSAQAPRPQRAAGQDGDPQQQAREQAARQAAAQRFGFGGQATSNIVPEPPPGERYRFNWNTPIHISPHNPRTIYVGAEKLFKSVDRGDNWTAGPDLTKNIDRNKLSIMGVPGDQPHASKNDGASTYGNIITIGESPVLPGVLWVGTDDGNIQVSRDGGASWKNVVENIQGIPKTHQVSRVEPSHFDAATCYVSIDGHRNDDFKPYIFVTRDYGATWKSLSGNLPSGNVNVIREDPKNKNLLFAGTEYALYISLNGGAEWKRFMTGLPTVRVDDILVHPRDNDLIVGTHGRGVWIIDDITPLQQLADEVMAKDTHLFEVRPGTQWLQDTYKNRYWGASKNFEGENPEPGTAISYYLKSAASEDVKITVSDITGKVLRNLKGTKDIGLNRVQWDLREDPPQPPPGFNPGGGGGGGGGRFRFRQGPPVDPGTYIVKVSVGGKELTTKVVVEADTWNEQ
ncbi:MAG: hypothetical protein L0229_11695 [Blastocatellia bacterium]|nr:hypothetical protein [Blastocatellia bacterium]